MLKKYFMFITAVCLVFILLACSNNTFEMTSRSMEPTIKEGEIITADFSAYKEKAPERWDVVVFQSPTIPDNKWAMRIVGLPGEEVSYDSLGILINGERLSLPISNMMYTLYEADKMIEHPYVVPENRYYLLGDNVDNALDSRYWGTVDREKILGKIVNK